MIDNTHFYFFPVFAHLKSRVLYTSLIETGELLRNSADNRQEVRDFAALIMQGGRTAQASQIRGWPVLQLWDTPKLWNRRFSFPSTGNQVGLQFDFPATGLFFFKQLFHKSL